MALSNQMFIDFGVLLFKLEFDGFSLEMMLLVVSERMIHL